jgi:hypothetical protein
MDFQDPDEVRRWATQQWATQQWATVDLADERPNKRAALLGEKLAAHPDGSLPEQTRSWGELKAAYRLLGQEEVTFERLSTPHWLNTRQQAGARHGGVVLFIQDGSDLDFRAPKGPKRRPRAAGQQGGLRSLGLLLHSCLATLPEGGVGETLLLGLAHQKVWARQKEEVYRGNETRAQSAISSQNRIRPLGGDPRGDRPRSRTHHLGERRGQGQRRFQLLEARSRSSWVGMPLLRVGQDRRIQTAPTGEIGHLFELLGSLAGRTETEVEVRGGAGKPKRTASLKVDWRRVKIMPPRNRPEQRDAEPIEGWCVRAWEEEEREDALEWILFCTLPVAEADSALEKVGW